MKLNPESTVLQQLDEHWQKMAALILWKLAGSKQIRITANDIQALNDAFAPGGPVIYTHGHKDSLEFQIVDGATAERLAAHDAKIKGRA